MSGFFCFFFLRGRVGCNGWRLGGWLGLGCFSNGVGDLMFEVWIRCTLLKPFGGRYWLIMTLVVELIRQSMMWFNFLNAGASCMLARECLVPSWHLCRCFDVFDLCSDVAICPRNVQQAVKHAALAQRTFLFREIQPCAEVTDEYWWYFMISDWFPLIPSPMLPGTRPGVVSHVTRTLALVDVGVEKEGVLPISKMASGISNEAGSMMKWWPPGQGLLRDGWIWKNGEEWLRVMSYDHGTCISIIFLLHIATCCNLPFSYQLLLVLHVPWYDVTYVAIDFWLMD